MASLSSEKRAALIQALEPQLAIIKNHPLHDILSIMLALLHDYQELEDSLRAQVTASYDLVQELEKIYTKLRLQSDCVQTESSVLQ